MHSHLGHHIKRKHAHKNHEGFKKFINRAIFIVAFIGPIMTLPQIFKIWVGQNAAGVSIVSWGTYIFTSSFWLIYGIIHKEKPIIFSSAAWVILEIFIVIGTFIYS